MISKKIEKAIIDQIKKEEYSSRLYLAMASWCHKNGYPGAAAFLYTHSDEERLHQLKFVHFLNDRDGYSVLQDIEQPPFKFDTLQKLFQDVLKHEQYITASINEIYHICMTEKDYTTANFLQWFITEQVEEENLVRGILDTMALAGNDKSGLFHIDKELGAKAGPSTGGTASAT
ncbi:MAG: ferritin [Bacteroidales bacterium]|jgi:ferritin|nr:ferritin [Bacteroidales bacterium]